VLLHIIIEAWERSIPISRQLVACLSSYQRDVTVPGSRSAKKLRAPSPDRVERCPDSLSASNVLAFAPSRGEALRLRERLRDGGSASTATSGALASGSAAHCSTRPDHPARTLASERVALKHSRSRPWSLRASSRILAG